MEGSVTVPERAVEGGARQFAIARLRMPKRARNALLRAGIVTLEDAREWSDRALLSLPHIGLASVASLRAQIDGILGGE